MHLQARDELEAKAQSLESDLLEARECQIHETETHSAKVSQLQRQLQDAQGQALSLRQQLEDAQGQALSMRQQQQMTQGRQAAVEALQRECEQLRAQLKDAEAKSQVQTSSCGGLLACLALTWCLF